MRHLVMMCRQDGLRGVVLVVVLALLAAPARGQTANVLELDSPVKGHLDAGQSQTWAFSARNSTLLSFLAQTNSGNLDPVLTIHDPSGKELIANDDYNYPDNTDALLQAITIPAADNYTVTLSGVAQSAGDYTLTMLPGFARLAVSDHFDDATDWQAAAPLSTQVKDGQLTLSLAGIQQMGIANKSNLPVLSDFYLQVQVAQVTGRSGWSVGLVVRQDGASSYLFVVSNQGFWRFVATAPDGTTRVIRDWKSHPAIVPGDATFQLGVLVNGTAYDLFYNGQFIGQVVDSELTHGTPGLMLGTPNVLNAESSSVFDDLLITVPFQTNGNDVLPQQLLLGNPASTVQELERRRAIPSGGRMALNLPQSSAQNNRPGVTLFPLAHTMTFANFAMGTRIALTTTPAGTGGCGLVFRQSDDSHYGLAYIDQTGGYGVSRREGDTFQPGIFGQYNGWQGDSHRLVVVAKDSQLVYYVDGILEGSLTNPSSDGTIGEAVVNFEPVNTVCQFNDTWLWELG